LIGFYDVIVGLWSAGARRLRTTSATLIRWGDKAPSNQDRSSRNGARLSKPVHLRAGSKATMNATRSDLS